MTYDGRKRNNPTKKKLEPSEKSKLASTWEYLKWTQSKKRIWNWTWKQLETKRRDDYLAVTLVSDSIPFLKGAKEEVQQKENSWLCIRPYLHPRDDIDRLYGPRKEGRGGIATIPDSVTTLIRRLEDSIKKSKERLITATRKIRKTITRKQNWEEKQLHWYFKW